MIVREIATHPELLETFDWFNDYKDTRSFLARHHPAMLPEFLAAYLAAGAMWGADENTHRIVARATPAGKFLWGMGWDYWDTEASARSVAEHAAGETQKLKDERTAILHDARKALQAVTGHALPPDSNAAVLCRNSLAEIGEVLDEGHPDIPSRAELIGGIVALMETLNGKHNLNPSTRKAFNELCEILNRCQS